jgi:hypothetical protein
MLHYFVDLTGGDGGMWTCFVTTDYDRATAVADILATENCPVLIRTRDLTADQAVQCWYRLGMRQGRLTPPARYRYAYELGRRMTPWKREG